MKRIALFRFHLSNNFDDIRNRVLFFKKLNPNVDVYGLYGGEKNTFLTVQKELSRIFVNLFFLKEENSELKWRLSDLTYQMWYNSIGSNLDFDVLHPIEWDLIFMESLDIMFAEVQYNTIGCTGLIPLHIIENHWYWTSEFTMRNEWLELLYLAETKYNYDDYPFATQGPGIVLPKDFLHKLNDIQIPPISVDELRIPLYAQMLKFDLVDNGLFVWNCNENSRFFNCNKIPVSFQLIELEMKRKNGFRAIHPFLDTFVYSDFLKLI